MHVDILRNVPENKRLQTGHALFQKIPLKAEDAVGHAIDRPPCWFECRTIYRVTHSIFRFQRDFLEKGVSQLKPLVLRDVAEDIHMHESTISRVTTNKYVHTPQGVFELKFFFNSAIQCLDGESVSSESVKEQLKA